MLECERCHRHFRAAEDRCPFCARGGVMTRAMSVLGGAVTTVILAACYGVVDGPTKYPTGDTSEPGPTGDTGATTTTTAPAEGLDPVLNVPRDDDDSRPAEKASMTDQPAP